MVVEDTPSSCSCSFTFFKATTSPVRIAIALYTVPYAFQKHQRKRGPNQNIVSLERQFIIKMSIALPDMFSPVENPLQIIFRLQAIENLKIS